MLSQYFSKNYDNLEMQMNLEKGKLTKTWSIIDQALAGQLRPPKGPLVGPRILNVGSRRMVQVTLISY